MSNVKNAADSAVKASGGFINGYKEFVLRGNVIDLAVGIVIGAAFGAVIKALVDGILNPLVGAIFGQPNLDQIWTITINGTNILPGMVLTALINFLLVALAIYAFVVAPMNHVAARRKAAAAAEPKAPAEDVLVLREIRDLLAQGKR